MAQVCSKCAHPNPPEAVYCYFDGVVLGGHAANGRTVPPGSQPFPSQFVFPAGQACRNFDQLATTCQQNWPAAVDLLRQGHLANFLSGIGRSDLAMAAKEAARFPDIDRGLDRFLAKLPTQVLDAPKLRTEPTEVSLGVVEFGSNRSFELHLANLGLRLLYGTVTSDCKWLTLGDAPGNPQKLFQFGGDVVIHVQIRGKQLRAGNKPLEGHLLVESNAGTSTVTVRAEVPLKPFPSGVLAGANTPRQIAEKAVAAPKDAAPLFESGAVAKWFGSNGWTYPVRGPSASGVGGVQQFFEALGLAKPPKVEISQSALTLKGEVGQSVQATLELKTLEKRPVYGHAVCDQPWLDVGRATLNGRNAVIPVVVPHVPDRPGETLQATVNITSNGNQKFKVPVSLEIAGAAAPYYADVIPLAPLDPPPIKVLDAIPLASVAAIPRTGKSAAKARPIPVADVMPVAAVAFEPALIADALPVAEVDSAVTKRRPSAEPRNGGFRAALHGIPAVILALVLLALLIRDLLFAPAPPVDPDILIDPNPRIVFHFGEPGNSKLKGSMTFGVVGASTEPGSKGKQLTFDPFGRTNSTMVKVDGIDHTLGDPSAGTWTKVGEPLGQHGGKKSVWLHAKDSVKIEVTQLVEMVPGEPIEDKDHHLKRFYDTCRIRYVIENKGSLPAKVGLRMLLDTCIGFTADGQPNDGVPFTVPGKKSLIDKQADFNSKDMPDFIQVLEHPSLSNPGAIGFVNLKLGSNVEPPSRLSLTRWPGFDGMFVYSVPMADFAGDSAVVLYWNPKDLKPGAKNAREVGFSYGLGTVSSSSGKLGISVGGNFVPNGDITLVAYVNSPTKGQKLTLKLPEGLELAEGQAKQDVPPAPANDPAQPSHVDWRIRALREGTFEIEVVSSTGVSQKKKITIKAKSIF